MRPDSSTPRRSLMKGISWESISLLITFLLAWCMFGQIVACGVFAVVSFFVKLVFFYSHERIWHQIPFGKRCFHEQEKIVRSTTD